MVEPQHVIEVLLSVVIVACWRGWWPLQKLPESWHPWVWFFGAFMIVGSAIDGVDDIFEAIGSGQPLWALVEGFWIWLGFLVVREFWAAYREVKRTLEDV